MKLPDIWIRSLVAAGGLIAGCAPAPSGPISVTALINVTIVDVERGVLLPDHTIVIAGSRVRDLGRSGAMAPPAGARVIDGQGGFLIPGLWDMHVHLGSERTVPLHLYPAFGITSVRDVGGPADVVRTFRDVDSSDGVPQPRIFFCGPVLDGSPPSWPAAALVVRSATEVREGLRTLRDMGASCAKAYDRLGAELLATLVTEASRLELPVLVHPSVEVGFRGAAEIGVHGIEHLHLSSADVPLLEAHGGSDSLPLWDRQALLWPAFGGNAQAVGQLIERLRRTGTFVTPTLNIDWTSHNVSDVAQTLHADNAVLEEPVLREWAESAVSDDVAVSPAFRGVAPEGVRRRREFVAAAVAAGVPMLAGSGGPWLGTYAPGSSLHRELELLVEAGVPPAAALQAATINAARFFTASDSLGTIDNGYIADFVLLDENPLEDIRNTRNIRAVILGGRYLDRAAIDSLLGRHTF